MSDDPKALDPMGALARKVARDTGISEAQARDLILMVGSDYSSIVREAKILKRGVQ